MVAVVDEVTVRWADGRSIGRGRVGEGGLKGDGEDTAPSSKSRASAVAGDGDCAMKGSAASGGDGISLSTEVRRKGAGSREKDRAREGDSTTLNRLVGLAKGLEGRSEAGNPDSCDGRLTNGFDPLSESSEGDRGLVGELNLVGEEAVGVEARTVEGDVGSGDSGRRKGDARGELKAMGLVGDACEDQSKSRRERCCWQHEHTIP